ncbi:hypothetical protein EUGRSUZ_A01259 [Eucalyptus grandis]|uniref:Uncharacterized protein n=2 Tax=Eucalyptus grandis TaxID=71139 RepID=A0ACC3M1T0_EUCGR|nr:hypothetical protein EUGRSUZ_A01259 [Eucalyptus grandis]
MEGNGPKRTFTMNWDALGDEDDDDRFFESRDRLSCAIALDLASSNSDDDDDEDFEDSRISFASAVSGASAERFRSLSGIRASTSMSQDYEIWISQPGSISERRKRLFQGMGLSNKDLLRLASAEFKTVASKKVGSQKSSSLIVNNDNPSDEQKKGNASCIHLAPVILVRSRSDGDIDFPPIAKRKEEFFGATSKQRLTRTSSTLCGPCVPACRYPDSIRVSPQGGNTSAFGQRRRLSTMISNSRLGAFFLIKNLDTGKGFIVNEYDEEGMWNRLSDLQTGKQLTMEEFEKSVGYSPVVKELMRRENVSQITDGSVILAERKFNPNSYLSKSLRLSKRSGVALLKNIKGVANSMSGLIVDKERENQPIQEPNPGKSSSEWVKVRQHGKSYKELSALRFCQEIQAHEGSIWTMKFNSDGRYLASAGEDKTIHVWKVQDCDMMPPRQLDEWYWSPTHSLASSTPDRQCYAEPSPQPVEKKKGKGSLSSKKGNLIPDYVHVPETVFSLSESPVCSFTGHLDDVLDLSWSKSELLLSSSMDKTVRLWDVEMKSCLKLFAHNDYVTCIQFNPIDDMYFISGSLDAKIRIWSIPDRHVIDWTDLHEMVTAVCYTPDGEGAIVGSHKGGCRMYSIKDCKLKQISQLEIQNKKKSQAKKITGFQFSPCNSSEVLVTSADSRVRIVEGSDITHKLRGFRNTSSQIAASFTQDGKYVISASEDSQVYVWKRETPRNSNTAKAKALVTTKSYEHFPCRDVSVAIPWPGTIRGDPPAVPIHSKRNSKRSTSTQPPVSNGSPTQEDHSPLMGNSKRQMLPPLPKKANPMERASIPPEEDLAQLSRLDSGIGGGIGESFNSDSSSARYGESPSISVAANSSLASWSSSWSWFDSSNSNGANATQATAWGMVIVTGGLRGEIRAYQNFGLPRKVGRQANLF